MKYAGLALGAESIWPMGCPRLPCRLLCRAGWRHLLHGDGFPLRARDVSKPAVQPMGWRRRSTPGRMGKREGCSNVKRCWWRKGNPRKSTSCHRLVAVRSLKLYIQDNQIEPSRSPSPA